MEQYHKTDIMNSVPSIYNPTPFLIYHWVMILSVVNISYERPCNRICRIEK